MANHAKTIVTPSSRTSSSRPTERHNLVAISAQELDGHWLASSQMSELVLPARPSRIAHAAAAARPATGAAVPGVAVRVQPRRVTSPLVVPRVAAPTLPLRQPIAPYNVTNSGGPSTAMPLTLTLIPTPTPTSSNSSNNSVNRSLLLASESEVITLSQPRPDGERVRNEYIDTPLKGGLRAASTPLHAETHIHISGSPHDHLALVSPLGSSASSKTCSTKSLPFNPTVNGGSGGGGVGGGNAALTSPSLKRLQTTRRSLPITKQPAFSKDASSACRRDGRVTSSSSSSSPSSSSRRVLSSPASQSGSGGSDSVICPDCDRCRCLSCRTPRPLPSKWLCGDKCLCSAESCVDYVSCLCCVKAIFYHCGSPADEDDHLRRRRHHQPASSAVAASAPSNDGSCADAPCSCVPSHHRMARWACLASLTLVMPCLLCYWPLQAGVKLVEMCYHKCTRHGCQCDQHQQHTSRRTTLSSSSQVAAAVVVQPLANASGKRLLDI